MNPYARFRLVSNAVSAAAILGALALIGAPLAETFIAVAAGDGVTLAGAGIAAVTVMVIVWVTMTEAIFPALFRFTAVRRMILGKYYMEGTWLQSERGKTQSRMSVIDIQPKGNAFMFTGYSLNENLEIESNSRIEFSRFDWPFMVYKHRNSLSDGTDGLSEGVGELQFEMNQSAARRYNGFLQYVRGQDRLKIEGVKLTNRREINHLRSLEGRREICSKYWQLFYNRPLEAAAQISDAAPAGAPVIAMAPPAPQTTPIVDDTAVVIPRRKASDWVKGEDEHPIPVLGAEKNGDHLDIERIVDEAKDAADKKKVTVNGADHASL